LDDTGTVNAANRQKMLKHSFGLLQSMLIIILLSLVLALNVSASPGFERRTAAANFAGGCPFVDVSELGPSPLIARLLLQKPGPFE
jgi:hypothetical protein